MLYFWVTALGIVIDLVNLVDRRHAQDQYYSFSFESFAPILQISDYYHLIIGQMIKFYSR